MKFFSLIENEEVHIAPDAKTIPAKEFSKLVKAAELLKQTKKEEVSYRNAVAKECETLKEQAERAGFEAGMQAWSGQIKLIEDEIKKVRTDVENSMVPLALAAVKKIIGREIETNRETIVDIISTALKAVSQHKKIKIYVCPSDYDDVEEARPRIKALFEHLESLVVTPREDITEGGCVIETEAGIINAQLESQLKALESAFVSLFDTQKKKEGE